MIPPALVSESRLLLLPAIDECTGLVNLVSSIVYKIVWKYVCDFCEKLFQELKSVVIGWIL